MKIAANGRKKCVCYGQFTDQAESDRYDKMLSPSHYLNQDLATVWLDK